MGTGVIPRLKRAPRSLAGAGGAIVEARQPARDAPGRGPREVAAASASPSSRRMPEPNTGDRNSYGSRVHEFRTAKLRRGSPDVCPRPGTARMIEDCYDFPMGSDF